MKITPLYFLDVRINLYDEFRKLDYETLIQIKAELESVIEEKVPEK